MIKPNKSLMAVVTSTVIKYLLVNIKLHSTQVIGSPLVHTLPVVSDQIPWSHDLF